MKNIANIITVSRIIIAFAILFTQPLTANFYILYIICGLTDMVDGFIARRSKTESEMGEKLDSIADIVFVAVCFIRLLPVINIPMWLWLWIAVIALIRVANIILGYVRQHQLILLHTVANKIIGLLLFLLPLTFTIIEIKCSAIMVCVVATFAAVQEGFFIRKGKVSHE